MKFSRRSVWYSFFQGCLVSPSSCILYLGPVPEDGLLKKRRLRGTSEGGAHSNVWPRIGEEAKLLFISENTLSTLRTKSGALLIRIIKWRSVQECGLLGGHSCRRLWEERLLASCNRGLFRWDFLSQAVLRAPTIPPTPQVFPPTSFSHL